MSQRKRAENFSNVEKECILDFMERNSIIESKDTSVKTQKHKKEKFEELRILLDSQFATKRSIAQIKNYWKKMKCNVKKAATENRKESFKTGGGKNPAKEISADEERVMALVAADIDPLPNQFDGDAKCVGDIGNSDSEDSNVSATHIDTAEDCGTSQTKSNKNKKRKAITSQDFYELSERRLKIEERKAEAQERIAAALETLTAEEHGRMGFLAQLNSNL